ncbi:efflux RND transporter periplasmic adaptor subunit [Rhizobium miluonense]|uniref:efflux RND transporter periplasmic adaptor subunit n=1 Tax=Rhizobium miluonense TaxID=411945 RepID=UPI001FD91639|nr:efflux RND transporter periplasmic adaptor subunit [Rhizobium miluonense]
MLLVAAISAVIILVSPNSLSGIKNGLLGQPEPAKLTQAIPLHDNANKSGELPPISRPSQPAARDITGSGYVVAPHLTAVFSKYEGKITGIAAEVGDRVKAGQILAVMEDASARLALEQAEAAKVSAGLVLAAREITLAQAAASFRRTETLTQRAAASRKDLEDAETAVKQALNNVEQSRQDVVRADITIRVAQEQVDELTIRAPFDGTVTRLNAHIGDTVLARADSVRESQSLLALADTTSMVIDADMAETNISLLRPGLIGEAVLDGFPDRPFGIEIQRVAPIASAEKGTIGLRLSLINPPAGIRPNMAARIRIPVPESQAQIGEAQP